MKLGIGFIAFTVMFIATISLRNLIVERHEDKGRVALYSSLLIIYSCLLGSLASYIYYSLPTD